MNKCIDVLGIGEILIDFTPAGKSDLGFPVFECNPGGGPPNVLVSVSRLGGKAAFVGKVGKDDLGSLLKTTLLQEGIDTSSLHTDNDIGTTLAFVTLDETGNRSFSFFRNPGADIMLTEGEIDEELIKKAKIVHHGSLSCTVEPTKSATLKTLSIAKENNLIVSYDPNLRLSLWKSEKEAKSTITDLLQYADIVKLSDEEFEFITGEKDFEKHAKSFMREHSISLLFVTLGPKGAFYCHGENQAVLPTYDVKVIDTTGSGDSFIGACLYKISQLSMPLRDISKTEIESIIDFANASGSMAATKKGGIPSIPTTDEVLHCIKSVSKV